jgi:hypothetical protein
LVGALRARRPTERHPVIAWGLTDSGTVIGLVESDDPQPVSVTAVAYDQGAFAGYYRDGQTVCMHQIRDNAKTFAEDPNWCSECRGEIRPSR